MNASLQDFAHRHIGPRDPEISSMLDTLGFSTLEQMATQVVPKDILKSNHDIKIESQTELEMLTGLKQLMSKNKIYKSLIGLGFHDTFVPPVIQRNILENPVWYTAYTPYQAEISQGRLESLLNFQTMVSSLTGMEIANSSMLDEGTAAAEAMAMAYALNKKASVKKFLVSPLMHSHTIEVLKTRAEPLGLEMILQNPLESAFNEEIFAAFVQYPNTVGNIEDFSSLALKLHQQSALLIVAADLLSLTLLKPPGEWGADIVVGNTQRFGVPLGFGGPHAAFLATKDNYKRLMPGRLVGVSVDSQGQRALRLALQTREQHIRREKATSNICTAQVLLANMASMYAVYHGPRGLKEIASNIFNLTHQLAKGLESFGLKNKFENFFDTLCIETPKAKEIHQRALEKGYNLWLKDSNTICLSFNETCTSADVKALLEIFSPNSRPLLVTEKVNPERVLPSSFKRTSVYLDHPVFNRYHSETEMLRYIHFLQNKDMTLTHCMIPLGSCTMKLNATSELMPVSWPEINQLHPFAPVEQASGLVSMIKDLEKKLSILTGFAAVSVQPNAGSQGEYAGLLVIRKYFQAKGQANRNICLIPSSAHGTNPASAAMVGMNVVVVNCDDQGNVDIQDLKQKALAHKNELAALMITYPSTHGVFEEGIREICSIIHDCGGQVYMDGANLNALVGLCLPGEFGPDVSHMNLHKTFAIPHGGGGPGVGPIGVREHLKEFLPTHSLTPEAGPRSGITAVTSAPWGSASILPISWAYIQMMGSTGLRKASLVSILNANYIAKKLSAHYPILYRGAKGLVAHECIIDLRGIKKTSGIDVTDVAKRLMDYGFHAPTMSWPVPGTLMIEPTESESKAELDRFIEAMIQIRHEISLVETGKIDAQNNMLINAPHTMAMATKTEWNHPYTREQAVFPSLDSQQRKIWPGSARVDNAYGDRNLVCACPSVDSYREESFRDINL